jgi:hypothetical protein
MLPLIAVGFVMMTIGVALLCLGAVPIGGGKRIPALRSRLIGVILVSFLPLALGVRQAMITLFAPDAVEGLVVSWSICGVCWFAALVILFRVLVPKRDRKSAKSTSGAAPSKNPFGEAGLDDLDTAPQVATPRAAAKQPGPVATKKPPANKPSKPASQESNPFDFS